MDIRIKKFSEYEPTNEGVLDFLKKFFAELKSLGDKVENSKEIDTVMDKAKKDFDVLFKQKEADLKKLFDEKQATAKPAQGEAKPAPTEASATSKPAQGEAKPAQGEAKPAPTEASATSEEKPADNVNASAEYRFNVKKFKVFEADATATAPAAPATNIEKDATATDNKAEITTPVIAPPNPVDKAIDDFINEVKNNRMKKYLDSKNDAVKYYALNKLSELNQYILNRKIEVYKMQKGDFAKTLIAEETKKLETSKANYKTNMEKLKTAVKKVTDKLQKAVFSGTKNDKSAQKMQDKLRAVQSDKKTLMDIRDNILGLSKDDFVIHDKDNKDTVEKIIKDLETKDKAVLMKVRDKIGLNAQDTPL